MKESHLKVQSEENINKQDKIKYPNIQDHLNKNVLTLTDEDDRTQTLEGYYLFGAKCVECKRSYRKGEVEDKDKTNFVSIKKGIPVYCCEHMQLKRYNCNYSLCKSCYDTLNVNTKTVCKTRLLNKK